MNSNVKPKSVHAVIATPPNSVLLSAIDNRTERDRSFR